MLIRAWEEKFLAGDTNDPGDEAAQTEGLFRAAALRQTVEEPESQSEDEPGQEPRGAGWRGMEPPLTTGSGPATREIHDGAGLCSPGRWPIEKRRLPDNEVNDETRRMLKDFAAQHLSTDLFAKLACGRIESCPSGESLRELRDDVCKMFQREGAQPRKRETDEVSHLEFRLLGAFR